ncbi:hypothetical protein BGZ93_001135 [Podila epicladia]|nr:hypothetical protein BGZ93_001135 [Podila epicladia]
MFHDDENLCTALDRESSRIKSRYRAMKEIQLRPYGQDDEDEVDDANADDVTERSYLEEPFHPFDNQPDTHNEPRDVDLDALIPYKQALKEDYDTSPHASDAALSEESQQELYRMAFACSPASIRMQQYQVPEYGHYYPDRQQSHGLNQSATSTSIASSGTLKSKGRASLTRTKTVLRQVKRRVSVVAQTVVTQANQALVRKNAGSTTDKPPQDDRQLWIQQEEGVREEEYSQHFYDSHSPSQRHDYGHDQHTYSSEVYHDHHGRHDEDPAMSTYKNHFENNSSGSSLGGDSRFESSNSIRRNLYSASRSSLNKSKTLLRQVKRRVSNAAQSMVSHVGSLSWKQRVQRK